MTIDLEMLRSWIGRSTEATDAVTPRLVAEFRATLDPHLARVAPDEAPLTLHWCLAPPTPPMSELGPDGHAAKGGFLPPVPLPRRMWAGGSVETTAPIRLGDAVTRRSTVTDVSLKEGRSGSLCFVTVRHELSTARGVALTERHDIVYRDVQPAAAQAPARANEEVGATREAALVWEIDGSAALLFRYSALTFNTHRIHYDLSYVTQVEGYPGLVVHGPLQATLLFNLAGVLGGGAPRTFDYRGKSPLFAGDVFRVKGKRTAAGITCWTENASGQVCMEAEAC